MMKKLLNNCEKKKKYKSKDEAIKVIDRVKSKKGLSLNYYLCLLCDNYHLTRRDSKEQKKIRRITYNSIDRDKINKEEDINDYYDKKYKD